MAKADLHVHSKHSNRPSEWILRQFGAPESFTEPLEVYHRCRERGMDFVTISDHDTIDGAREILHLPGTFASCEVTVSFPEDGCEIHCLVFGIDEAQHREIQELRGNVYELRDYLRERDVLHSVAHPLFRVNDRLTLDHLERLLVLFDRFEALNGIHDRRQNDLVRRIFGSLTPEMMAGLAERHRLEPMSDTPWIKTFTGGSDDHGGFYIATTYTETPPAATVAEYLAHLRAGRHDAGGDTGSSLRLTQSLYSIAHKFYQKQFPFGVNPRKDPFSELLRSLGMGYAGPRERGLRGRLAAVVPFPGARQPEKPRRAEERPAGPDRLTFEAAARASQDFLSTLVGGFLAQAKRGRLDESLAAAATQLAPLALSLAPFLVALRAQHKDADLLDLASQRFLGHGVEDGRGNQSAWFTDDLEQAHDALRVLADQGVPARERSSSLVAITCGAEPRPTGFEVVSFRPMMTLPLPGYEPQVLTVPPLLEVLEHCERTRYRQILVSTPGPLGLIGLAAGKLLGIPVTGIYDTTLPGQVRRWTGSHSLEEMSWLYLRWLFGAMDALWVASRHDRERLAGRGFDVARVREERIVAMAEPA
ncbi:MAG TPA: glycosyltransferase [Thermoanaerobaculia bacterium]|nr:glycosyltransferase [Thermoanaerobaculia bacterium]